MMKGVNLRMNATNKGGPAMASFSKGLKGIKKSQDMVKRSNVGFMKGMNSNRRVIQQVGMQVSDLGVQIAGGQSAILSLTQNVPQVVQMFGAWGGILAALITLIGTFTLVMIKSGKGINDIIPFMGALSDEFSTLSKAVVIVKDTVLDTLNLIINNLDVLFISLSIIAAFMVKKWVVSFLTSTGTLRLFNVALLVTKKRGIGAGLALIRARGGAILFGKALGFVKKAIITTGIGALIVLAGYLIERLLTLKQATGSWGATFKLLGDVAKQTFNQLPKLMGGAVLKIREYQMTMLSSFIDVLAGILTQTGKWADPMIGAFVGVFSAIKEIYKTVGSIIVNPIIDALNMTISKSREKINILITMMNKLPNVTIPLIAPDMGKIGKIVVDDTRTLGERVAGAFKDGLGTTYVGKDGVLTKGMQSASDRTKALASQVGALGDRMLKSASDAIPAWKELKALLASTDVNDFDIRSIMGKDKDKDKDKVDSVQNKIDRTVASVRNSLATLDAAISESSISNHVSDLKKQIMSIGDIPSIDMTNILSSVDALKTKFTTETPAIRSEIEKLKAVISGDLKTTDPDGFFKSTEDSVTRIQQLMKPLVQDIENIKGLNPKLARLQTDDFIDSLISATTKTRSEFNKIRDVIGSINNVPVVKLPEIDLKPLTPLQDELTDIEKQLKSIGESISRTMTESFKGLIRGTKSFRDVMTDVLDTILDKMLEVILNPIFNSIGGSIAGGLGGLTTSLMSFDGGGFTGRGARVGGMDGKGGKLAMVHPNESVIDHSKGGSSGSNRDKGGSSAPSIHIDLSQTLSGAISSEDVISLAKQQQTETVSEIRRTIIPLLQQYQIDGGIA